MKMWHVGETGDEDYHARNAEWSGGWVVLAESPEEAIELVKADQLSKFSANNKDGFTERYYFLGVRKDQRWPLKYVARPIGPIYLIPFLGYH